MKFDKYHFSLLIVCLIQAGVILAGVVLWVLPQKESAQAQKPPPPLTTADTRTLDGELERAQKLVSARLKDPYSARFSDLVHKTVRTARGEPFDVVCGQVNARNSYGGYGGEKLFVYFVDSGQVALGEGKVSYTNVDPLIAWAFCGDSEFQRSPQCVSGFNGFGSYDEILKIRRLLCD